MPQGLWSYDLQADKWSPCPLPEGLDLNSSYGANQFAVLKDRLYLCVSEALLHKYYPESADSLKRKGKKISEKSGRALRLFLQIRRFFKARLF